MSDSPGCTAARSLARSRTAGVSSSSRQGGAQSPSGAPCRLRWSATRKYRISSTVSPKNSIRSGCSSVGGKTSSMPPRTARSPRFSTSSARAYPISTSRTTTSSKSAVSPGRSRTGSSAPRPPTIGWSRQRTGAATTVSGPDRGSAGSGWASRRSTASRCPEVSERGDRRSCGSVSQGGKYAAALWGNSEPSAAVSSSASRAVAVTASTNLRAAPPSAPAPAARARSVPAGSAPALAAWSPAPASAAARKGRSAGGAIRSAPGERGASASSRARLSWGSSAMTRTSPGRLIAS